MASGHPRVTTLERPTGKRENIQVPKFHPRVTRSITRGWPPSSYSPGDPPAGSRPPREGDPREVKPKVREKTFFGTSSASGEIQAGPGSGAP